MSICDKDCFNCPYDDCICNEFSEEDLEKINALVEILTLPEKPPVSEKKRTYYERHKEERKAYQRDYYAKHKQEHAIRRRAYYERNRQKIIAQVREYERKHREQRAAAAKRRYRKRLEEMKAKGGS